MAKFRKKPVVIEAVQFTGENLAECLVFTGVSQESADGCQVMGLPEAGGYLRSDSMIRPD